MATYTIFIVTRNARHHYPVIMANNGKAILNEPVKRRETLSKAAHQLLKGWSEGDTKISLIHETLFKKMFPKYAANKGPKPSAFKAGMKVKVTHGTWQDAIGTIKRRGLRNATWVVRMAMPGYRTYSDITIAEAHIKEVKPAPAKRITKAVTNPVK